jgi:hypothetical protein
MGTASEGSDRLRNLSVSTTSLLNQQNFPKVLSIPGVLYLWPPLLLPTTKGKREKEELMQEMHCIAGMMTLWLMLVLW